MSKKKKRRSRDVGVLWKGKVARVIGQSSDSEVMLLARLIMHRGLSNDQKYLVLEGAIFDVWGQRLADREEEVRARRKRDRERVRQEKDFSEPTEVGPNVFPQPSFTDRTETVDPHPHTDSE